jgi:beta-phosphoglucomutase-like phosphatase (HAD superfamily)
MSTDAKTEAKRTSKTHALIFELEYVAAKTRAVEFDSLKSAVGTKGVELTPVMFSRSGMSPQHRAAVTDILTQAGKKSDAIEKAVAEVDKTVANYCENEAELDKGLEKLIKATLARDIPVIAFTALPEATAKKMMAKLGLDTMDVQLLVPEEVKDSFPRADDWLKMLKQCDKEGVTLVAVVSSQVACKGALTAGAACIAIPDEFTAFQDFSGAKLVLDSLADEKPDTILDLTLRM